MMKAKTNVRAESFKSLSAPKGAARIAKWDEGAHVAGRIGPKFLYIN
jgi:hypothetical protein